MACSSIQAGLAVSWYSCDFFFWAASYQDRAAKAYGVRNQTYAKRNNMELDFELTTEGFGEIEIWEGLPDDINRFPKLKPTCTCMRGAFGELLFYELLGPGVMIRFSVYNIMHPVILKARADKAVLELRVAIKNRIKGIWESIMSASLPENRFCISYASFVKTRAEFDMAGIYATYDFHYDLDFLQRLAKDFPIIDDFLEMVSKEQSIHIAANRYVCSTAMMEAIDFIEHNPYSERSQKYILEDCAKEVLLAALEKIMQDEVPKKGFILTDDTIDKLNEGKSFIESTIEKHIKDGDWHNRITLGMICEKCVLNEYVLKKGFKILFDFAPIQYYVNLKMKYAAKLLLEGKLSVSQIAYTLEYTTPGNFSIAFRKYAKCSPSYFQKHGQL
jgi:AraC-like DNA-binding protein